MPIVGGLDIHRKQITFDYLDTVVGWPVHRPADDSVQIVEGDLLPMDVQPSYDGHRDLLKLPRTHERPPRPPSRSRTARPPCPPQPRNAGRDRRDRSGSR